MEEAAASDAEFLSLLQEIERADASLNAFDSSDQDAPDLFDVFLGGSDGQTPATEGMNCDSAVDTLTVSSVSRADRCRLNRKRKKHELEELRAAAAALELTLAQLIQPPSNDTNSLSSPWQQAARLARVERWKAIAENKRLRETLARQWTAAQRIHQAIRSTPVEQPPETLEPSSSGVGGRSLKRQRPATSPLSSLDLYDELFQNISSAYEQNQCGDELARLTIGVRKISMDMVSQSGGSTDMTLRVMECQRLPFSFSTVANATWNHLSTPSRSSPGKPSSELCGSSALTNIGNDVFGECGAECNPSNSLAPGRFAIRRYAEPNRLTFVWECDGCYQCDGASNPIGRVTERGWCTIEPSDDGDGTLFRIQVQYVPHTQEPARTGGCCAPRTELSSGMALGLYRATIARSFGAVEREVFKDAACHTKPPYR